MLKAQLVEAFQRIYHVLPATLQHSCWIVMALTVVAALAEFALAGAVSLLGVVLASPQSIVYHPFMQQLVDWLPVLRPVQDDPRLLLALLLCLLCGTTLLKTVMLALLTWRQSRYSQLVSMHLCTSVPGVYACPLSLAYPPENQRSDDYAQLAFQRRYFSLPKFTDHVTTAGSGNLAHSSLLHGTFSRIPGG